MSLGMAPLAPTLPLLMQGVARVPSFPVSIAARYEVTSELEAESGRRSRRGYRLVPSTTAFGACLCPLDLIAW